MSAPRLVCQECEVLSGLSLEPDVRDGAVTKFAQAFRPKTTQQGARRQIRRVADLTLPDLRHNGATEASTTVLTLTKAILAPHEHTHASRIAVTGSDVPLSGSALTSVALLLHELTTNAAKYGALASPAGRLTIDIEAIGEWLHLKWEELSSKPLAEAIQREGFGTTLEKAVLKGLGGTISRDWKSNGLTLSLEIPLARLAN